MEIHNLCKIIKYLSKQLQNPINIMEVCGTHTHQISKYGIKQLLPSNISLISGPGCPVCVTPSETIDKFIELTKISNICIATYGDMIKVPGSYSSLAKELSKGANVKIVYSSLDAIDYAKQNPTMNVVFLGIGFETTCPSSAFAIKQAYNLKLDNFSVYCAHKNMPNALEYLLKDKEVKIDGLLLPGHVSTIIGTEPYNFIAKRYNTNGVITGFKAEDILLAICCLLKSIIYQQSGHSARIYNAYKYGVKKEGNKKAQNSISEIFTTTTSNWRGLGRIANSGYKIKNKYSKYNAEHIYSIPMVHTYANNSCKCGKVLKGIIQPTQCPLFKKKCTPINPIGPCMVSSEGTCAAAYKYEY